MKKYISQFCIIVCLMLFGISCSDSYLVETPPGAYSEPQLANLKGVEGLLISTYAALDGTFFESWGNQYFNQVGGASNWVHGSIRGGDSYKGTEPTDFVDINPIERHEVQPSNGVLLNKWTGSFDGITHANEVLRVLKTAVASNTIDASNAARLEGEARFLRGHFHFELLKTFGVPPFVDETISTDDLKGVKNDENIWPKVEADFQFAFDNLPGTQINVGRANKWAAASFLAKVKVYQGKFAEAKAIFDNMIGPSPSGAAAKGTTAAGNPYKLTNNYSDNFKVATETGNTESIFAYEASVYDGTFANGNYENTLNQPHGSSSKTGCCGFFQPTQSLVNAFKTDAGGLPLITTYNNSDLLNDEGIASSAAFTPDLVQTLDPRLDHTVGRRGLPYMDWGIHPGTNWIRQQSYGGPYSPKKNVPAAADLGSVAGVFDWGFAGTAKNVQIMRYADVLLLAAECEAELGNVAKALDYVNAVRNRAKNSADFVGTSSQANYLINTYPSFASAADAVDKVRFERMIELAMEGHRAYDLARWDRLGAASKSPFNMVTYLNAYITKEKAKRTYLEGAAFTTKYRYEPIPEYVITQGTVGGVKNIDQSTDWGGTRTLQ
jgi:starch-binding outer membrane protein, SusD/RagB family